MSIITTKQKILFIYTQSFKEINKLSLYHFLLNFDNSNNIIFI